METAKQSEASALFHLIKSCTGSGILSMPIAFKYAGLVVGTLCLILTSIICAYCTYLVINCSNYISKVTGTTPSSFADVAEAACKCGPSWAHKHTGLLKNVMSVAVFLGYYSCLSIYTVIIAMNLENVITYYWMPINLRIYMAVLIVPFLLISYVPNWERLATISLISNLFMIGGVVVIIYYSVKDLPVEGERTLTGNIENLPTFFSIIIFSSQMIGLAIPLNNNMRNPEKFVGVFGVLNKAAFVVALLYFLVGLLGYIRYGDDTEENITLNLPNDSYAAQAVQLLIVLSIFGAYGTQFFISLEIIWEEVKHKITKKITLINYIIRTLMIVIAILIAVAIPSIVPFMSLVGAICFSTAGIIMPMIINILTFWNEIHYNYYKIAKCIVVFLFGVLAMISGTVTAIIDIIALYKD
ncbi:hypothetical protein FQA39_LY06575 [Lamprigera yunnana]|nr:hypothetical protein FQA39_LY06575 [Lamprigera yunnana]